MNFLVFLTIFSLHMCRIAVFLLKVRTAFSTASISCKEVNLGNLATFQAILGRIFTVYVQIWLLLSLH